MVEVQRLLRVQVEQAARGAHDDVDSGFEQFLLRLVRAAAVDGGDGDRQVLSGLREVLAHLDGELARGHDDERPRSAVKLLNVRVVEDAVEEWDAETQRLAHAGAGLTDEIVSAERDRQRELLDGKRVRDSAAGQGIDDLCGDTELRERGSGGGLRLLFRHTSIVAGGAIVGPSNLMMNI